MLARITLLQDFPMPPSVILTPTGKRSLEAELEELVTVRRPLISKRIEEHQQSGEHEGGGEHDIAKDELASCEGRIEEIREILNSATIIDSHDATQVSIGGSVQVRDDRGRERTFTIVGSAEIDPTNGRISNDSPAARALLGAKAGESVSFKAPGRKVEYEVIRVW